MSDLGPAPDGVPADIWDLTNRARDAELKLDLPAADALFAELLVAAPCWPGSYLYSAGYYRSTARDAKAETLLRRALNQSPPNSPWEPFMRWTLAAAQLSAGKDTSGAWAGMRQRFNAGWAYYPKVPCPEWKGEPLNGRRLIILREQGFGDEIQFARFAPLLQQRGIDVVLVCAPELRELFLTLGVRVRAVTHDWELRGVAAPEDRWVSMLDLPAKAGFRLKGLRPEPYLSSPRVTTPAGASIGVVTNGSPGHPNDGRRSLPSDLGKRLLTLDGAMSLAPADTGARNFAKTAAIIAGLDLVITVDTSVAHLAGAMGKPVWIMLPGYCTDWRWMRERTDTPWYPSARLYRQELGAGWEGVLDQVERDVAQMGRRLRVKVV